MITSTRITKFSLVMIVASLGSLGTVAACGSGGGDLADARVVAIDGTPGTADARATPDAHVVAPDAQITTPDAQVTTPDAQVATPDAQLVIAPDATVAAVCGNGIVEPGEDCDDHNFIDYDGCTNHCISTGPPTILISQLTDGASGSFFVDDDSKAGVDQTGRYSTFSARTTNSIDGMEDSADQVYLHDAVTNTTTKISLNTAGAEGHSDSQNATLSDDARFVAWQSQSDNFATVTAQKANIFVRDLQLGVTTLVSADADGNPANDHSFNPVISADGNFVVFASYATNLTPEGANGTGDIYVRDLQTQTVTKISDRPSNDGIGNQNSFEGNPSISSDGNVVLFDLDYGDLSTSDVDGSSDMFVHATEQNTTSLLGFYPTGLPSDGSNSTDGPIMSTNGRYVMFASSADYLVAGAPAGVYQIYVQDLVTGITTIASISSTGDIGASSGVDPVAISGDGRFVAFSSGDSNLEPGGCQSAFNNCLYVHDNFTGVTNRADVATEPDHEEYSRGIGTFSDDGQFLYFMEYAYHFISEDDSSPDYHLFRTSYFPHQGVLAQADGLTTSTRGDKVDVSVTLGTQPFSDVTIDVSLSNPNVASLSTSSLTFTSDNWNIPQPIDVYGATDLTALANVTYTLDFANAVSDDDVYSGLPTPSITLVNVNENIELLSQDAAHEPNNASSVSGPSSISNDGRFVAFASFGSNVVAGDSNDFEDVFIEDTLFGIVSLVSVDSTGVQGNGDSSSPAISSDGRFVVFVSNADNLVAGDTNSVSDVFVRDLLLGTTTIISVDDNGDPANGVSLSPSISTNGQFVAFSSVASNLVAADNNNVGDIFVRDTVNLTTTIVSVDTAGDLANGASNDPVISADGTVVAFDSTASNLVLLDNNGDSDVFTRDLVANRTTIVSLTPSNGFGDGASTLPSISGNGQYVAFQSTSTNLVAGDNNGDSDVFVRDRVAQVTSMASVGNAGAIGNGPARLASISGDGRFVAFVSSANNLTTDSVNAATLFVRDLVGTTTTVISTNTQGAVNDSDIVAAAISANGTHVAFTTSSDNLVAGDVDDADDVFLTQNNVPAP